MLNLTSTEVSRINHGTCATHTVRNHTSSPLLHAVLTQQEFKHLLVEESEQFGDALAHLLRLTDCAFSLMSDLFNAL